MPLTLRSAMAFTHQRAHACWGQYSGHEHSQKHDRRCGSVGHFQKLYPRPREMRKLEQRLLPCRGGVLIRRIALNLRTSESETAGKWLIHSHTRGKRRGGLMMILADSKERIEGSFAGLIRQEFQTCGWKHCFGSRYRNRFSSHTYA